MPFKNILHSIRVLLFSLMFFDHRWYGFASGLSGKSRISLYRHFLALGVNEGLDPNRWFSCSGYLRANPDVARASVNPWIHFVGTGHREQRRLFDCGPTGSPISIAMGPLNIQATLERVAATLIDQQFYAGAYPDVSAAGLNAAEHFLEYGWSEGRAPAPWFNIEFLRTHTPTYRLGSLNPLTELLRISTGLASAAPPIVSWWVDTEAATSTLREIRKTSQTLVIIHAYYPEDLWKFEKYLGRLGEIQLVITCPANSSVMCSLWAEKSGFEAVVVETLNRGRDWWPLVGLAHEIAETGWESILKLHTKRSPHRSDGADWMNFILDGLVPDDSIAARIDEMLSDSRQNLVAAPGSLADARGWVPQSRRARDIYAICVQENDNFSFPAGSMFWMSGRLFSQLPNLKLSPSDFEPELGQLDGTLAHALERIIARLLETEVSLVPDQIPSQPDSEQEYVATPSTQFAS